jgi:LruC domain-containing protein/fimbrial isopeptide formation D2 family protein/uncharacterized repeat protein (TIGR01451 family)
MMHRAIHSFSIAVVLVLLAGPVAAADTDGSADLDLWLSQPDVISVRLGSEFTLNATLGNASTSEATAHQLEWRLRIPDGLEFVSSPLGTPAVSAVPGDTGAQLLFATGTALVVGDQTTVSATFRVDAGIPLGTTLSLSGLAVGQDSPYGLGAAPDGAPPGTPDGGLDVSAPSSAEAMGLADASDDAYPTFPEPWPSALASSTDVELRLFDLSLSNHVAECERATGTTANAFNSTVRVTGNAVAEVTDIELEVVLPENREFLGFVSGPAGVTAVAIPNTPTAGQTTLSLSGLTAPVTSSEAVTFSSGIVETDLIDATNAHTTPPDPDPATQGGSLVADGGASPGGGETSAETATVVDASFETGRVGGGSFPPDVTGCVESEYLAVQSSMSPGVVEIGDTVTITSHFQVSEYLTIAGPSTFTVAVPDGMAFNGAGTVASTVSGGTPFAFSSAVTDSDGDTTVEFTLAVGQMIPAAATGTISFTTTVDGAYEGAGDTEFEASETLSHSVVISGTVADEGTTDPTILGSLTADGSGDTITNPRPTLETRLVRVETPDGTLYDGTPGTPAFTTDLALPAGTELTFALIGSFPNVPVLGVVVQDSLPLYAPPDEVTGVAINAAANRQALDIFGAAIPANDDDGDGFEDSDWNGRTPLPIPGDAPDFPYVLPPNAVVFDLDDAQPGATASLLLTTAISADVPDVIPTDGLIPTRNVGIGSYVDDQGAVQETFTDQQEFTFGVPYLTLTKEIVSPIGEVDAHDEIEYLVTLENTGSATAFLKQVVDSLPDHTELVPGSVEITDGSGADVAADPAVVDDGLGHLEFFFDLAPGFADVSMVRAGDADDRVVEIAYRVRVLETVPVGTTLVNGIRLDYYSRPDATDSFGPLDADTSIQVLTPEASKSITSGTTDVTIGDTVDYQISVAIPEGVTADLVITDMLPTGLSLVEILATDSSPALDLSEAQAPTVDGGTVTWNLGTVTNSDTDNETAETVTLTFQVVVANIASNRYGVTRTNSATATWAGGSDSASAPGVLILEPRFVITKTVTPGTVDASDDVQYELRLYLKNWRRAPAYEVVLTDVLPAELTWSDTLTVVQGPTPVVDTSQLPTITLTWAEVPDTVTSGSPIIIRYGATVDADVPVGASLVNDAVVTYTGQPGSPALLIPGDETSSERTGDPSDPGGSANSYRKTTSVSLAIAQPDLEKVIHSGSDQQPIRGSLRYRLNVEFPEGAYSDAVVRDELPAGMVFLGQTWSSVAPSLGLTLPSASVDGRTVTWTLGDFTNTDGDNGVPETIAIEVEVGVTNVASNQAGTTLSNTLAVDYNGRSVSDTSPAIRVTEPQLQITKTPSPDTGDAHDLVVYTIEVFHQGDWTSTAHDVALTDVLPPSMNWIGNVTSINGPAPVLDTSGLPASVAFSFDEVHRQYTAGNPLTFTYTLQVDPYVQPATDLFNTISGTYTSMDGTPTLAVPGDPTTGERTGNPGDPGGTANDYRATADGVFHVRQPDFAKTVLSDPTPAIGDLVTYRLLVTVPEAYHPRSPEALVSISDTLPDGLLFLDQVSATVSPALSVGGSTIPSVNGQTVSWALGAISNTDDDDGTAETIELIYRAVVLNTAANQRGAALTNAASLQFDGNQHLAAVTVTVAEPELVVRKDFDQWLVDGGETVTVRMRLFHTPESDAPAYDTVLVDDLGSDLSWIGNVSSVNGPAPVVDTSALPVVRFSFAEIDPTFVEASPVEFTFDLQTAAKVALSAAGRSRSTVVSNTVDLAYTSVAGDPGLAVPGDERTGERTGDVSDSGGALNDYRDRDAAQLNNVIYVAFEDLKNAVEHNDFDYNDLILRFVIQETLDDSGRRIRLEFDVEAVARGAGYRHQVMLDIGVVGAATVHRRTFDAGGSPLVTTTTQVDGDWIDGMEVFADSMDALPAWGGGAYPFAANTDPDQAPTSPTQGHTTRIIVDIHEPALNPPVDDNPFTMHLDEFLNELMSPWIHVLDTGAVIRQRWAHSGATQDLVTHDRYPDSPLLGMTIDQTTTFASSWRWPSERSAIWSAFAQFPLYVFTGQTFFTDWYLSPDDGLVWPDVATEFAGTDDHQTRGADLPAGSRNFDVTMATVISSSPGVADVDNDGDLEVVIGAFLNDIAVLGPDGSQERLINPIPGSTVQSQASVTLADLDGDDDLEILRGYDDGALYLMHHDGSAFGATGWVDFGAVSLKSSAAVADVAGSTAPELIVLTGDMQLRVVDLNGAPISGFPVALGGTADLGNSFSILPSPVVADLDGDGSPEIVQSNADGDLWIVDATGSTLSGWPVALGSTVLASPAGWDLDADGGNLEIVVATDDGAVAALNLDGSERWSAQRGQGGPSSPAAGDLDGDGAPDIVVGSMDGKIYAFDADGQTLAGWPVVTASQVQSSPALVDVDGDGSDEVFIGSYDMHLYGLAGDGTAIATSGGTDFPVQLGSIVFSSPAVGDLDCDGQPEVVVGCYDRKVYAVESTGSVDPESVGWAQFRSGADHRGLSVTLEPAVADPTIFADGFEDGTSDAWSGS